MRDINNGEVITHHSTGLAIIIKMTFEKEFPSLMGLTSKLSDYDLYTENVISAFCLDKERVRELIKYLEGHVPSNERDLVSANHTLRELKTAFAAIKKELKL